MDDKIGSSIQWRDRHRRRRATRLLVVISNAYRSPKGPRTVSVTSVS